MKKLMIVAVGLATTMSTGATAQSVLTQNVVFGPTTADVSNAMGVTTNGAVAPFFFFDSRVGTLNSITYALSYQLASVITVRAGSSASGSVFTESAAQFLSDDAGITQAFNRALNTAGSFSAGGSTLSPVAFDVRGNSSSYALTPGSSTILLSNGMSSRTFTDTTAANLAAFTRLGTFSYNPLITTLTNLTQNSTSGNVTSTDNHTLTGTLTISYNITPLATGGPAGAVPEPGVWAMMMFGIGLTGMALRRRQLITPVRSAA